jgi:hypothetical protein
VSGMAAQIAPLQETPDLTELNKMERFQPGHA